MALLENDRGRPGEERPLDVVTPDPQIVPPRGDILADLDALAAHVDGTFVVVVKVSGTRYRRRCFLTAKAAENAARRATDRGESATVYMAELKPLWVIAGGEA